jgi:hypothetical protein
MAADPNQPPPWSALAWHPPAFFGPTGTETMTGAQSADGQSFDPIVAQAGGMTMTQSQAHQRAADAQHIADLTLGMVGGLGDGQGIIAYHGSPHSFDRFDMSKIGTGEGAQAYGHGLYFAGNEDVARSYRDTLSPPGMRLTAPDGSSVVASPSSLQFVQPVVDAMSSVDGPAYMKSAIARAHVAGSSNLQADAFKNAFGDMALEPGQAASAKAKIADMIDQARPVLDAYKITRPGNIYQVALDADPAKLLDWDKPVAAQPAIQQTIASLPNDNILRQVGDNARGSTIYDVLKAAHAGWDSEGAKIASRQLLDAGIPGIKYADQGSRGMQQQYAAAQAALADAKARGTPEGIAQAEWLLKQATPTSNYVMFDDRLINILKKYGIAGLMAGGAATQMPMGVPQQ